MATYQFLEAPHLTNEIIGRLNRYESLLLEVKHEFGEVHSKLDQLLSSSTVDHTFGFHGLSTPIGLDQAQVQAQNGPLGLEEFNRLGTHLTLKRDPSLIDRCH